MATSKNTDQTETTHTPQRSNNNLASRVLVDGTNKRNRSTHFEPGTVATKRLKLSTDTKDNVDKQYNVEKQYKELVLTVKHRKTERITHLCHCTSKETKQKIQEEGIVRGHPSIKLKGGPLARNGNVKGVWFLASLYRGELHTRSPYGSERIKIPVSMVMTSKTKKKCQLFFESTYMFERNPKAQYVRMILANKDSSSLKWCMESLHEVDITKNPLLCWNNDDNHIEVVSSDGDSEEVRIYMEVLLLGDLELPQWDTVENMACTAQMQPTFGLSSKLNCENCNDAETDSEVIVID